MTLDVSRETHDELVAFTEMVLRWNKSINLVSRSSETSIWDRHVIDSARLMALAPKSARIWVDVGSGGGFPGIVVAILMKQRSDCPRITMIESDIRKSVFLQEAARSFDLNVSVLPGRVEDQAIPDVDVISARAVAPLDRLLDMVSHLITPSTVLLFPKGVNAGSELTEAEPNWRMNVDQIVATDPGCGPILRIREVERRP